MQGLDEEELRQFVAKFAGRDWEEFFEALFGYEAKLAARAVLLARRRGRVREKHAAWREPLIAAMDRIEKARQAARERKLLQAVERAELLAAGATAGGRRERGRRPRPRRWSGGRATSARPSEQRGSRRSATGAATPIDVRQAVAAAEQNPFAFIPNPKRDSRERVRQPVRRPARPRSWRSARGRCCVAGMRLVGSTRNRRRSTSGAAGRDANRTRRWKSPGCRAAATAWVRRLERRRRRAAAARVALLPRQRDGGFRAARGRRRCRRAPVRHPHRRAVPRRTRRAHARLGRSRWSASALGAAERQSMLNDVARQPFLPTGRDALSPASDVDA